MVPIVEMARHPVAISDPLYLYEPSGVGKGSDQIQREANIAQLMAKPSLRASEVRGRRPIVAVIGDARVEPGSRKEREAERVGKLLVERGFRVLTGGLGGVMEAACRGARSARNYREGDTIGILPGFDPSEASPFVDVPIVTGLDHVRNTIVSQADAVIAIGGGAGTLAEMAFAWLHRRLIVALPFEGWSEKLAGQRLDHRSRNSLGSDDRIFAAADANEAVQTIVEKLDLYQRRHRGFGPRTQS